PAVEDEDADRVPLGAHGNGQRGPHPRVARDARRRDPRILGDVGNPKRLLRLPDGARETHARWIDLVAQHLQVALDLRVADAPGLVVAQHAGSGVNAEEAAALPAFALADGAQRLAQRLAGVGAFGEAARHGMLEREQLRCALALGDVAADAAIAAQAALGVEQRLAADGEPARAAVGSLPLH